MWKETRDLWEGIPEEIKEQAIQNIIANLENIGLKEGHTIAKHAGKDELYLNQRLDKNPNLNYVSTFYSKRVAELVVQKTMTTPKNKQLIKNWLKTVGSELVISTKFKTSLGIIISQRSREIMKSNISHIVLEKCDSTDYGFRVKTAYLMTN